MNKILLHAATVRNDGRYVDAGETLVIGDAGDQIDASRADALVDRGLAADATVEE
ncbi:hypothetical protein [Sphingomonas morindae]|uniref:Amidohydrolase n=1 Tax=Sphingomonas morindae TaxID=1541170 RepID=A0ABY4X414_9SPHN|nr:hypothetical protein [Sphingomonas morindae]USI71620.1 hypothetical protein LHA26_09750 [Sphingomonas morindae]